MSINKDRIEVLGVYKILSTREKKKGIHRNKIKEYRIDIDICYDA